MLVRRLWLWVSPVTDYAAGAALCRSASVALHIPLCGKQKRAEDKNENGLFVGVSPAMPMLKGFGSGFPQQLFMLPVLRLIALSPSLHMLAKQKAAEPKRKWLAAWCRLTAASHCGVFLTSCSRYLCYHHRSVPAL
ncbi:hypothetical protein NDU88_002993 [Pleurodeles waltl]|uniref:Secreted protein n=1 Tax=Pleurodeles waltl TaxID=8319 RepID=A0AAV7V173_PLEWA|nr:hypothetical protein NDU88_002993 [Pleurodeles waltl]